MKEIVPHDHDLLLERLMSGEEAAFTELYSIYSPSLIAFAAARLASIEEATDIIHDIFVRLWEDRNELNIKLSIKAYLFAATRYRIIDHLRRNARKQKIYTDMFSRLPNYLANTEDKLYAKQLEVAMDEALNQLSPRVREVFKLSRYEHLSIKEIADKLEVSESTVKNQLTTALSQLRGFLGKYSFLLWWL